MKCQSPPASGEKATKGDYDGRTQDQEAGDCDGEEGAVHCSLISKRGVSFRGAQKRADWPVVSAGHPNHDWSSLIFPVACSDILVDGHLACGRIIAWAKPNDRLAPVAGYS
jgi:hypothetical protein